MVDHAIAVMEKGHHVFEEYPDALNPFEIMEINDIDHEHVEEVFEGLIEHYGLEDEPTDKNGPFPKEEARKLLAGTVEILEYARDFFGLAEAILHETGFDEIEEVEEAVEEIHDGIDEFYRDTLNPLRRSYDIYSKAPLNEETVAHLRRDIVDKIREAHQAMLGLRDLGVEFYPTGMYERGLKSAHELTYWKNDDH